MAELQRTPLHDLHLSLGAKMVPFAGWDMPVQYPMGVLNEHLHTRSHAGLFDVSHMGQLVLSGEGLDTAVEAVLPIDLATLALGAQRYSLLLDEHGGVLDDLMVTRWREALYLVVNGATKWDDIGHLREHLPDEITLNHLDDRALFALQGPKAFAALDRLVSGEWPLAALTFMRAGPFLLDGTEVHISRSGYTGEDGFEISLPADQAERIADLLCEQPEVKPIGLGARDSLRLEAGLPLYGHDLTPETSAVDADLRFAINKRRRADGGFLGAERVLADFARGTPQRRIGLTLEGRQAAREGAAIYADDQCIGSVSSGGFSPSLNHPIAMGYVATAQSQPGTPLTIEVRGKHLPARVVPMPFVPHRYSR